MGDNGAVLDGYTQEVEIKKGDTTLYLLVKPGTDLTERFRAWDMDQQEYVYVEK